MNHTHTKFGGMINCAGCHPRRVSTKNILQTLGYGLAILIAIDLLILFAGLLQIGIEDRTGYWSPFWRTQAEVLIKIIN